MHKKKSFILAGVSLALFILIALGINLNLFSSLDGSISHYFSQNNNSFLVSLFYLISAIFDTKFMILISIFASLGLVYYKKKREAAYFVAVSIIAGILIYLLKNLFLRIRPSLQLVAENGYSYPSGHATIAVVFFGFLIFLSLKYMKDNSKKFWDIFLAGLMIFLIGFARIYLNVHWFSDVIGGYCLGAFLLFLTIGLYNKK